MKGKKNKPIDIITTITRYIKRVIIIGTATFLILSPLAFLLNKLTYFTSGTIKIEPVAMTTLSGYENSITSYYKDFIQTQIFKIHSKEIIERALNSLPEEKRKLFIKGNLPYNKELEIIWRSIGVKAVRDSHLININFTWKTSEGMDELVNAIMKCYLTSVEEEIGNKNNKRLNYLNSELQRLDKEIKVEFNKLKDITDKTNTSTFSEQFNPYNSRIAYLNEAYIRAYDAKLQSENRYLEVVNEIKNIKAVPLTALIDEMVEKDQSLWDLGFWTYKTLQEMRASLDGMTLQNTDRKYVEDRMKNMSEHLEKLREDVRQRATKVITNKRDYTLKLKEIDSLSLHQSTARTENQLWKDLTEEKLKAAEVSKLMLIGARIETNLKNLRTTYDQVTERIYYLTAESMAPSRLSLVKLAEYPFEPSGATKSKLLALIFMVSYGWIGGLCIFIDLIDNRIRKSKDIDSALGFKPNWPISSLKDGNFLETSIAYKTSQPYKAMESIAVRLNRDHILNKSKVVTFIPTDLGIGTTEIIINLADLLSKTIPKVLVVEIKSSGCSLGEKLKITAEDKIPYYEKERNIYIYPKLDDEIMETTKVLEILDRYRDEFDLILIDSEPILSSGITEFAAINSDVVYIVTHGDYSRYRELRAAVEIIEKLKIQAVSVILNWGSKGIIKRRR